MSTFDSDMTNEGTGSRRSGGGGFQSSNNRLAQNSVLREAENEVINMITKVSPNEFITLFFANFVLQA